MLKNISIILSVAAFIFAVLTFCIIKTNFIIPQIDTNSFLVSVLAILVTILLGWQIYNIIKIKDEITNIVNDKFREEELKMKSEITKIHDMFFALSFEFYRDNTFLTKDEFFKLRSILFALYYANKISIKDDETIRRYINYWNKKLLKDINNEEYIEVLKSFSQEQKKIIIDIINLDTNILAFSELKEILKDKPIEDCTQTINNTEDCQQLKEENKRLVQENSSLKDKIIQLMEEKMKISKVKVVRILTTAQKLTTILTTAFLVVFSLFFILFYFIIY